MEKSKDGYFCRSAYSGDQQNEVSLQHNDAPSTYKHYLDKHLKDGLQYLVVWCDNSDEKLSKIEGN